MKFYIASAFDLVAWITSIEAQLLKLGHQVAVRWWNETEIKDKTKSLTMSDDDFYDWDATQDAYWRDFEGIMASDAVIFVAGGSSMRHTGASVEIGIANAFRVPVYSLGTFKRSAMYAQVIRCSSLEEILEHLSKQVGR